MKKKVTEYKVFHASDGQFWVVEADTPAEAVVKVCGDIVEVLEHNIAESVFNYKTKYLGINGDEKFEVTSAMLV